MSAALVVMEDNRRSYSEAENLARNILARMESVTAKLKSLKDDIRRLWAEFDKLKAGETILGCTTKKEFCERKLNRTPRAIRYLLNGRESQAGEQSSALDHVHELHKHASALMHLEPSDLNKIAATELPEIDGALTLTMQAAGLARSKVRQTTKGSESASVPQPQQPSPSQDGNCTRCAGKQHRGQPSRHAVSDAAGKPTAACQCRECGLFYADKRQDHSQPEPAPSVPATSKTVQLREWFTKKFKAFKVKPSERSDGNYDLTLFAITPAQVKAIGNFLAGKK